MVKAKGALEMAEPIITGTHAAKLDVAVEELSDLKGMPERGLIPRDPHYSWRLGLQFLQIEKSHISYFRAFRVSPPRRILVNLVCCGHCLSDTFGRSISCINSCHSSPRHLPFMRFVLLAFTCGCDGSWFQFR